MPELPEVETIVKDLKLAGLIGKKIVQAHIYWPRIIEAPAAQTFISKVEKQTIKNIRRRAKYIVIDLSHGTLLIHLRMTGKFNILSALAPPDKHEHVRLVFDDKTILSYLDPRKFGRWSWYEDPTEKLEQLGFEPLSKEFTLAALKKLIHQHSTQIKPFLLNQKYVAGLGNIYVDEALWRAKIHPQTLANELNENEIKHLHEAIKHVLEIGVKNQGTSLGLGKGNYFSVSGRRGGHQNHLKVFRRDGEACPRCQEIIKKIIVTQRGTHFCPRCQIKN